MARMGAPRKVQISLAGRPAPESARPRTIRRLQKNHIEEFVGAGLMTWFAAGAARAYARQVEIAGAPASMSTRKHRHVADSSRGHSAERSALVRAFVRAQLGQEAEKILYAVLIERKLFTPIAVELGWSGWDANRRCAAAFRAACEDLARLAGSARGVELLGQIE